jgi:hypothetical protein
MAVEPGSIAGMVRAGLSSIDFITKRFRKPNPQETQEQADQKRAQRSLRFSRINVSDTKHSAKLPGVSEAALDTQSTFFAAFGSHAIHRAVPVSRAGLVNKGRPARLVAPKSVVDRATVGFHASDQYRINFKGFRGESSETIDNIADVIFADLKRPSSGLKLNETTLVVSEIGCGKSTLLTNLLYRINAYQAAQISASLPQTQPIEVVLVSFDSLDLPENGETEKFMEDCVKPLIAKQITDQTNLTGNSFDEILGNRKGANVVLIFDDLDAVYRTFCRDLILSQDIVDTKQGMNEFFPFVHELVSLFAGGKLSQYGLRCVFGLRHDTLRMLEASRGPTLGSTSIIENLRALYNLNDIGGEEILDVVKLRLELAKSIERDEAKQSLLQRRIDSLETSKGDFDFVSKVSVQGLRHTIYLIQQLDWAIQDDHAFKRFFLSKGFLYQYFLSGGYRHYSQINEGVTNIFLVNTSYRKENNPKLVDGKPAFSEKFLQNHKPTYFLKYLMLCLIAKRRTDHGDIVELFSSNGSYERELVELVLFSLCEVRHGRLIRPTVDFSESGNLKMNGLAVTARGKHALTNEVFWSFQYLAMIVEDNWLELPISVSCIFDNPIGALHLGKSSQISFKRRYTDYLFEKAKTVPSFITLLEAIFEAEKKQNLSVFESLEARGVKPPSFHRVTTRCREELVEMMQEAGVSEQAEILMVFDEWSGRKKTKEIRKRARDDLKRCF